MVKKLAIATIFTLSLSSYSYAAGSISNIGGAAVNDGETAVEARFGYAEDDKNAGEDGRFRMRQHIDHGLNDSVALRLTTLQDKREGNNLEHQALAVESRFQLIEKRDHGWDGGFRIGYSFADGDKKPDTLNTRLLATIPFGTNDDWQLRHDTVLSHQVGENATGGLAMEIRHQVTKKLDIDYAGIASFAVGAEMFNDFGRLNDLSGYDNQAHELGVIAKGGWNNGIFALAGYNKGISENGKDNVFKLFIGKKF